MRATFRINLIRGSIAPRATRRRIFWGMLLYLALCGGILAGVANHATRRLMAISTQRAQIAAMAAEFRRDHPGQTDMARYAARLKDEAAAYANKLEIIGGIRSRRMDVARVLLALAKPLPGNVDLANLRLDGRKRSLDFELAFPVKGAGGVDAGPLIDAWNQNAAIMENVGRIGSVRSRRQTVQGNPVEMLEFAGVGKGM